LWLWHDGPGKSTGPGGQITGVGQVSGLLGSYALIVSVVLMARIGFIERRFGLGELARWHRWAATAAVGLIVVHVAAITLGYAAGDGVAIAQEISDLVKHYPDVLMSLAGFFILLTVALTSIRSARAEVRRETWYFVHLYAYLGVVLALPHQLAIGSDFTDDTAARVWWIALYAAAGLCMLVWRVGWPVVLNYRHRLRVVDITPESPDVVSVHVRGINLFALESKAGQFFLWRFLTRDGWWQPHPFSLSAAPDGRSMRFTVKRLGDFTARVGEIEPGTKVFAEGPYGAFTATAARSQQPIALIAGGIGITPARALLETFDGPDRDIALVWRVARSVDLVLADEIDELAAAPGMIVHKVVGEEIGDDETDLLSPEALRTLVPDITVRDVYVSGPPGFVHTIRRRVAKLGTPAAHVHSEPFEL
jgi:predicted ferric reductase